MSMDPSDMDELLGAYALDAVDDDQRAAVEEYLASNPRAQAEVQEHREVATMLSFSGADAPDGLWDKIAADLDGRHGAPESDLGRVLPLGAPKRRRLTTTVAAWVVTTAAAAIIAVVAVDVSRHDSETTSVEQAALVAFADPSLRHAQLSSDSIDGVKVLAVVDNDGIGYLQADALPNLDDQRTYQLWGQVGDQLISLGLLGPHPTTIVFTANDDVSLLAITDEIKGGVASSQNPAVVAGPLA